MKNSFKASLGFIFLVNAFIFVNPSAAQQKSDVLNYFGQKNIIETWSSMTSQEFMNLCQRDPRGKGPDFVFSGYLAIQKKTLTLMNMLKVPEVPDLKNYHEKRVQGIESVVGGFEAALNNNKTKFEEFQAVSAGLLKQTDEDEIKLKSLYNISENDVQAWVSNHREATMQWMLPVIKANP